MSTGAAAKWLRERGMQVADRTVRLWCGPTGALADEALRTPGGQSRIRLSTLRDLLKRNGLDESDDDVAAHAA